MKNIIFLCLFGVLFLCSKEVIGQEMPMCGTTTAQAKYLEKQVNAKERNAKIFNQFLKEAQQFILDKNDPNQVNTKSGSNDKYIIPVVFHNIYGDVNGPEYISEKNARAAIDRLNQDFAGITANIVTDDPNSTPIFTDIETNPDCDVNPLPGDLEEDCNVAISYPSLVGKSKIEFRLAEKDPNGNPTNGITRTKSSISYASKGDGQELRKIIQWDRSQYLNIYIVETSNGISSGVAFYPESSHVEDPNNSSAGDLENFYYDGVAMPYWSFKPATEGEEIQNGIDRGDYASIITHEVGHWLGLRHTWGGYQVSDYCTIDDFDFLHGLEPSYEAVDPNDFPDPAAFSAMINSFNDTPNCKGHKAVDNPCESLDQYECGFAYAYDNFMEYTPCMRTFTKGQIAYVECILNSSISERGAIQGNLGNALYYDPNVGEGENLTVARIEFVNETFEEGPCTSGEIITEIGMRLKNATFNPNLYSNNGPSYLSANFYTMGLPANAGLTPVVNIINQDSAVLRLDGVFNLTENLEEIDFKFFNVVNGINLFNGIAVGEAERSKKFNIRKYPNTESGYHDICPNVQIGPNTQQIGYLEVDGVLYYVGYRDNLFYIASEQERLQFCMDNTTGFVKFFDPGESISGVSGNYTSVPFTLETPTTALMDVTSLSDGAFVYIGLKYDLFCDVKYGWLRLQVQMCGTETNLILHDYKFEENVNTVSIAGGVNTPLLLFSSNILEESLNDDGSFDDVIELTLDGTTAVFRPDAQNNMTITGPNNSLLDFQLDVQTDPSKALLSIANNFNPIDIEYETYTIDFTANAFTSTLPNLQLACDGKIHVDYYNPENAGVIQPISSTFNALEFGDTLDYYTHPDLSERFSYNERLTVSVQPMDDVSASIACDVDGNLVGTPVPGYMLVNSLINIWRVEAFCTNVPNSKEILLLDKNTLPDSNLGSYQTCEYGSFNEICDYVSRIPKDLYFTESSLSNFTDEAYVALRIIKDCGEYYYAWLKIDLTTATPKFEFLFYSHEANTPITIGDVQGLICEFETLGTDGHYLGIDDVTLVGEQGSEISNISTGVIQGNGTVDYTHLSAQVYANTSYPIAIESIASYDGFNKNFYAWLNGNQNPFFESDESILVENNGSYTLEIPNLPPATYRLRIMVSRKADAEACDRATYGEAEDYTIEIINTGTPPQDCCLDTRTFYNNDLPSFAAANYHILLSNNLEENIVANGEEVTLQAGSTVDIRSNFTAEYGSEFTAIIAACDASACNGNRLGNETNIDWEATKDYFKLYPNPSQGQFTIAYQVEEETTVGIEIYDINGQLQKVIQDNELQAKGNYTLNVNDVNLNSGVYLVKVRMGYSEQVQKLIKM